MSRTALTHESAAQLLGMKPREVIAVGRRETDDVVTTHDGVRTVVGDDGSLTFYAAGKTTPLPSSRGPIAAAPADPLPPALPVVLPSTPDADHPAPSGDPTTGGLPAGSDTPEPVPAGPVDAVLDWVGEDRERAQRALDAEQAAPKPRTGLTGQLEKLLAGDSEA